MLRDRSVYMRTEALV
uniref:Uncharacterized protein n=1 Tax=Anguilla anguilla TaxID=7936 RepID=A0A0E9XM43_ANGAN